MEFKLNSEANNTEKQSVANMNRIWKQMRSEANRECSSLGVLERNQIGHYNRTIQP